MLSKTHRHTPLPILGLSLFFIIGALNSCSDADDRTAIIRSTSAPESAPGSSAVPKGAHPKKKLESFRKNEPVKI